MSDKIQIVLVDDHPLLRDGVASTLGAEPGFEIVGQGSNYQEAIRLVRDLMPDLVLLDVSMEGGGINAARYIATEFPVIKIVMLTVSEDEEDVLAALKAGARGYVLKGVSGSELIRIVMQVYSGEPYVTPTLAASLLLDLRDGRSETEPFPQLRPREREILEYLATGKSNKEIAQALLLSEKTIKHHVTNILQKLHVRNRVEAALLAQKAGTKRGSGM